MRAEDHEPLPDDVARAWKGFAQWDRAYFPTYVGLVVEEIRVDYCRLRLPYRPELEQPAGIMHGGAIATLIDTVLVPAVGSAYPRDWQYATISMNIQYLAPVTEDAVAEGWIEQRGKSVVFGAAQVRNASGRQAAMGTLVYKVSPPRN